MRKPFLLLGLGLATTLGASATVDAARELVITKCGSCHRGPFLDLSKYPFYSDLFPTERELVTEGLRRAKLGNGKRMPPVNYAPLTQSEIETLEAYLSTLEG